MAAWQRRMRVCAAALVVLVAAPARSQQQTPRVAGSISGMVFDSLVGNAPLAAAEITVDGTDLSAVTDSRGRFRLDGVPPGRAVVRFYHAMLDSLGFGAPPVAVTVSDTSPVSVRLATPSPVSLRASLCAGPQPQASGVVVGRVRNVDDGTPLSKATATASWTEWSIGKGGLTRTDRRASAEATPSGAFALCGVPNDVAVVIRATAAGHVTGLVQVDLAHRLFAVRDFRISLADSGSSIAELARMDTALARGDSIRPGGRSIIGGVVRGTHGRVIDRAQVAVLGFPIAARTGSEGQYTVTGLPAGTQTIDVRAVGFAPQRLTLDLQTGERRALDPTLDDAKAQELAPVNIVGRGTKFDLTGFDDRRKAALGQFITDEEIKRRGVYETQQALWNVLGARVIWTGSGNAVVFTRESGAAASMRSGSGFDDVAFGPSRPVCGPIYWIDGTWFGALGDDIDRVVRPYDIRGMEVYVNPGLAPPLYRRPGDQCGVVLIWTKAPQPKELKQPTR